MPHIEQDWTLVEEYYQRLLQLPGPHPKIYIMRSEMTLEEALKAVKARSPAGQKLLKVHQGLTREMAKRRK